MVTMTPQQLRELELQEALLAEMKQNPALLQSLGPGALYQQSPAVAGMPTSPVLSEAPATGNKRDSVDVVQRSGNTLPEYQPPRLRDLLFGESGEHGDALMRFGLGVLSGRGLADGLMRGMEAFDKSIAQKKADFYAQQDRQMQADRFAMEQERHQQQMQQGELELEKLKQAIKFGTLKDLGNGLFYDFATGQTFDVPEAFRRELEIALAKAQIESMYRKQAHGQMGNTYIAPDGTYYTAIFDPNSNRLVYQNEMTGEVVSSLPKGSEERAVSGARYVAKGSADMQMRALEAATAAAGNIERYDRMLELAKTSGIGPGVLEQTTRALANIFGTDLSNVDLSDMQQLQQAIKELELDAAKAMRGQGQITENERKIIRESLPSMVHSLDAFQKIVDVLKAREERAIQLYDEWIQAPVEEKQFGFGDWLYRRDMRLREQGGVEKQEEKQGTTSGTAGGVRYRVLTPSSGATGNW